jgi:hypothetical protein
MPGEGMMTTETRIPMNTSNHLLVLSQSDFIERQLGTAFEDAATPAAKARGRHWLWLFHR